MEKAKSNKSMMIIFIVLVVILVGIILALAFSLMTLISKAEQEPDYTPPPVGIVSVVNIKNVNLGKMTTNLLTGDDGKKRAVVANFAVGINMTDAVAGEEIFNLITEHSDLANDVINSVLWNTTYAELMAENGEGLVKEKILAMLQEKFETNLIYEVYMSNIATQ